MLTDITQFLGRTGANSPKLNAKAFPLEIISIEEGGDEENAEIVYEGNPQLYDVGKRLNVVYRRNETEPDAIENRILMDKSYCYSDDKAHKLMDGLDEVIPSISYFYPTMTRITLKTVEGKLTAAITEEVDEIVAYLPIPPHLSHISTVLINELRRVAALDPYVDRVKWKDQHFAFKRAEDGPKGSLRELTILDRLCHSPNIIDLKAIVVNQDNAIRGFLMPYMHAGDFGDIFMKAHRDAVDGRSAVFDWSLKLSWARQVTQGVVDLHAIGAYNGDLKPRNVVLGSASQAILIDFLPKGFSEEFAAPEVLTKHIDHNTTNESMLTGPADVYSLGLVLYALAQETVHGVRVPLWEDGSTPLWYRDIVQMCLQLDPEARPSSAEMLSLLQKGQS